MIVIFWLFVPFFIGTMFVFILDVVGAAVMGMVHIDGEDL